MSFSIMSFFDNEHRIYFDFLHNLFNIYSIYIQLFMLFTQKIYFF